MSVNLDDDKDGPKAVPLDLARTQITTVRTVETNKSPLVMTSQALRSVRVLAQGVSSSTNPVSVGQTIITNLVPGAMLKQADSNRSQITTIVGTNQVQPSTQGGIAIQRQAQITLSATPIVTHNTSGTTYHVPRGPAVVANLAAPRSNVTTVRTPLVVTAQNNQGHTFVRPPRTPSPAQGTAWLTNTSNGSQIKGAPTVLSSPVRGATVTAKPPPTGRPQAPQSISTIRSGTILSTNAIPIGQTIHSIKPASGTLQIGNTVTLAQMLPARTQAVVYNSNSGSPFASTTRITVTPTTQNQIRAPAVRPMGPIVSGTRLTVPIPQVQATQNTRIVTGSPNANRVSVSVGTQSQPVLTTARLVTTQPSGNVVGRLAANSTVATSVANNILTSQARISTLSTLNLQSLMAVANGGSARVHQTAQGPKVITQPAATIHLAQIPSHIKATTPTVVTTATRTINVPASIVTQRPNSGSAPQAISIAKVLTTENQNTPVATSVFIHTPLQSQVTKHPVQPTQPSPSPQQTQTSIASSTPFSLQSSNQDTYFYENSSSASAFQRAFVSQQSTPFVAQPSQPQHMVRPAVTANSLNTQFQGMRFSSVMVVEQGRSQQHANQFQPIATSQSTLDNQGHMDTSQHTQHIPAQSQIPQTPNKVTSSPRPTILRKRDHEGTTLKAAKNLNPVLQGQPVSHTVAAHQSPFSPPSPPRPDSRGMGGHSSGSTTISATSSPGLPEGNEDSDPHVPMNLKEEDEEETKRPVEMSPRKKPRKQQLTGNDIDENHDDMQFISESGDVKKDPYDSDGPQSDSSPKDGAPQDSKVTAIRKPASASLLNGYRQNWKSAHNHFLRYTDVKPKEEKKPTIIDLAVQNGNTAKVNGWKIHHLTTQMEDLAEQEQSVYNQLTDLLKFTESDEMNSKGHSKEVNTVNELIKGNLQRIKIVKDGMLDAKDQIMKVLDHRGSVADILTRCANKRNFKKREKS